jgi:outer membrane protein assembly factor BamB
MRHKIAACLIFCLLTISIIGSTVAAADWPMFHYDSSHTGYTTDAGPLTNNVLWKYTTGGTVESSIVISGGYVYAPSADNNVYCLNATTGHQVWNYTTGGYVWGPAIANGYVYVGSDDHKVYCLSAQTGALVWSYSTGGYVYTPTVANGYVYIGSNDRNVYCLNASTGAQVWNFTTQGEVYVPSVSGSYVYIGSSDSNVYCLNANTGAKIWSYSTGNYVLSTPAVSGNGYVYVGGYDHNVYCLNASTGAQVWSYATGGIIFSSPAVANSYVYIGSEDNNVYCLNAQTGAQVWSYSTSSKVLCSPAVSGNGYVYVGSEDHKVYCLSAQTGTLVWSYTTSGVVTSSPALSDGVLYIGSFDMNVYAFGTPSSTNSSNVVANGWVPSPTPAVAAIVVAVALTGAVSFLFSMVSNPLGSLGGKAGEKTKGILPDNIKSWLEDFVESRHEINVEAKIGASYLPTGPEILAYGIAIVALTLAFSYAEVNSLANIFEVLPLILVTSVLVVLVQKFVSIALMRKLGVWSEYKIWPLGLVLFLVTTLAFRVPFSSPTRDVEASHEPAEQAPPSSLTPEAHSLSKHTELFEAIVPASEILVGVLFAGLFFIILKSGFTLVGSTGLAMCIIGSFFESLPIEPLDGKDIYDHSKMIWAAIFLGTLILFALWVLLL